MIVSPSAALSREHWQNGGGKLTNLRSEARLRHTGPWNFEFLNKKYFTSTLIKSQQSQIGLRKNMQICFSVEPYENN